MEEEAVAEAVSPAVVANLRHRSDVVRHRGRYAMVISDLTPQQAMVSDLLAVRAALEAADVDFILVRGNDERPVIAVDWKRGDTSGRHWSEPSRTSRSTP